MTDPSSPVGPDRPEERSGLARLAGDEKFSVRESLGGPRGMFESSLPSLVFIVAFTITKEVERSAYLAVGAAVGLAGARLARRDTPQHAISGLLGVAVAAFIAARTGRGEDFFLLGLIQNAAFATAFLVSILVRWPLLGLIVGQLNDEGVAWRHNPRRLRAYLQASWVWFGVFVLRLVVQVPLFLSAKGQAAEDVDEEIVALGVAKTAMGWPLWGLAVWLSWLILRRVPKAEPVSSATQPGTG